ncbi:hypothetical protein [Stenotrophomonas rhizophila]|uniref:hypothetical protein n=1 Tax=Stenotrophomonas rhizophila TaxID=216778 RepID=UPI0011A76586|nr:hypothetical protein [Stenotrophomonas rhizophila]
MTDAITFNTARSTPLILESNLKGAHGQDTSVPSELLPMDEDIVRLLTDAVAGKLLVGPEAGDDRSSPAVPVQLRPATITVHEASVRLTGIMSKLPTVLSALIGSQDPAKAEEGAIIRAAEGVTTHGSVRSLNDGTTPSAPVDGTTGVDADATDRSANAGGWLVSSPFSSLLALLRQLLLKLEKHDRDNSAQMVTMQRNITIIAGDKGVEKAKEGFGGAVGAAALTGVIGGAAMQRTVKATDIQASSLKKNQNVGTNANVADARTSGGIKAAGTPADQLRDARNLDGSPVQAQRNGGQPNADIQADLHADTRAINHSARNGAEGQTPEPLHQANANSMAQAQIPANQSAVLTMLGPGLGNTISAGVQIEAEMTEAERQLALQVADVFRRIADEQQDQAVRSREMRDAAAQLYESLLNLISATSAHIIQKS